MSSLMGSHGPSTDGEAKSKAALALAADPDSSITAKQATEVMSNESKKAGIGAYTFDPDATPEQKAAAAATNPRIQALQSKKPPALAIATDQNQGKADAYNLPPPTTAGVTASATSPSTVAAEEKGEYESLTGWAPRFGLSTLTEEEKNESKLDHTTFVESKLDPKYFGEWYQNAAVIIFACLSSWTIAILGGGLGWIFLVMAACGTYYNTSIRRVRRNYRDDVHREMAKNRLETDTESIEWINTFLLKFWSIYEPVLALTIINSVDQVLSTSTPAFLDSMRMKFFTLGTKPPRMEHVKTYPKAVDDIVLMDWKFSFTPNDTMDLTARQLKDKINPKIVLEIRIGKGMISTAMDIIVEDFAFSGLMRVKVKLQIPFPHVEKVEICFLEKPDIDYVCKPIGGNTLGFDINFIPGLESFIKEMIHANIGPIMYDPNVFPIEIAKMLSGSAVDQAIGIVAVTIHGAQGLKNPEFSGSIDPYTILSLNNRTEIGRTKTIKQDANPHWNETIYVVATSLTDSLNFDVFDFNEFRKDKELGLATFALESLQQIAEQENLQLDVLANGKPRGVIQADIRFFPVLEPMKLANGTVEPPPESNTGIAKFTIEQAKELETSKSSAGKLDPYAEILLNGQVVHKSKKLKHTSQPIWPDGSKEFLITDRKKARLGVVVKDDRDLGTHPIVGAYQIKLDDMLRMMEQGKEWYNLANAKSGRAKLTLEWKPVAMKGITGGSGGYITPIGVLRVHFQNARNVRNVETMGKSDPYVRVLISGVEVARTVTFQNNLNPDFDEVVYVPIRAPRERLIFELMDYQSIGKDRSLGLTEISASEYVREDPETGEYPVNDEKRPIAAGMQLAGRGQAKGTLNYTVAFYPTIPTVDPEEEAAEKEAAEAMLQDEANGHARTPSAVTAHSRTPSNMTVPRARGDSRASVTSAAVPGSPIDSKAGMISPALFNTDLARTNSQITSDMARRKAEDVPKLRLTLDNISEYPVGLIVIKLLGAELAHSNIRFDIVMDDMAFPSWMSSRATSRIMKFGETGDAIVREIEFSRITLRLMEKREKQGGESESAVYAKVGHDTLTTLRRALYKDTEIVIKSADGGINKVRLYLKYIPIKMQLDPSESINNMGSLRVDVLDAKDLPSADRNGYSDPYTKFELNGESIFKSKVVKKSLNPAWNENFTCNISSRTAAKFKVHVYDWDAVGEPDYLGAAEIPLALLEPLQRQEMTLKLDGKSGSIRLGLLFTAAYVTRSRQGTSTFSGTMGTTTKVLTSPVKVAGSGIATVGSGVLKGGSMIRHGFRHSTSTNSVDRPSLDGAVAQSFVTPVQTNGSTDVRPVTPATNPLPGAATYSSTPGAQSLAGSNAGTPSRASTGTGNISILSAVGYPHGAKVQVVVKHVQNGGKSKDVVKTKALKVSSPSDPVSWAEGSETGKFSLGSDSQLLIQVKDDKMFGDHALGDTTISLSDPSMSGEKALKIGEGEVRLRLGFVSVPDDAASVAGSVRARKGLLSRGRN